MNEYVDAYEKEMLQKIDAGEKLSEEDIETIIQEFEKYDERKYGENLRWVRPVTSIVALDDRYFAIKWYETITGYQENGFFDQPYEVERKIYPKTIMVTEWIKKEK